MDFTTFEGGLVSIEEADWTQFSAEVRGQVIAPSDVEYDTQRVVWNAMIDRRPGAIVRCAGSADVLASVRFAREHDLLVSVRGGGHNVAGKAVADGALMVDLSAMRAVHVDPALATVRVAGGCLWSDVDRETQAFGLATTGGTVSHTGVGGLDPRRWDRMARAAPRSDLRQPRLGRPRDGQRRLPAGQRARARRALLGAARRRRELRGGHGLRVPPPPGGADRLRRADAVAGRPVAGVLPRTSSCAAICPTSSRCSRRSSRTRRTCSRWWPSSPAGSARSTGPRLPSHRCGRCHRWPTSPGRFPTSPSSRCRRRRAPRVAALLEVGLLHELPDPCIDRIAAANDRKPTPISVELFFHQHGAVTGVGVEGNGVPSPLGRRGTSTPSPSGRSPSRPRPGSGGPAACGTRSLPYSSGVYVNHLDADDRGRVARPTGRTTSGSSASSRSTTPTTSSASTTTSSRPDPRSRLGAERFRRADPCRTPARNERHEVGGRESCQRDEEDQRDGHHGWRRQPEAISHLPPSPTREQEADRNADRDRCERKGARLPRNGRRYLRSREPQGLEHRELGRLRRTLRTSAWARLATAKRATTAARRNGRLRIRSTLRTAFWRRGRSNSFPSTAGRARSDPGSLTVGVVGQVDDDGVAGLFGGRRRHESRCNNGTQARAALVDRVHHGGAHDQEPARFRGGQVGGQHDRVTEVLAQVLLREGTERDLVGAHGGPSLGDDGRDRGPLQGLERDGQAPHRRCRSLRPGAAGGAHPRQRDHLLADVVIPAGSRVFNDASQRTP